MTYLLEQWKPVVGFEGIYEVSIVGNVRRVAKGKGTRQGYLIRARPTRDGYLQVFLTDMSRAIRGSYCVHDLVAKAFIGPKPLGYEVNHKDGVKARCSVSNLEYLTHHENILHAHRTGLVKYRSPELRRADQRNAATRRLCEHCDEQFQPNSKIGRFCSARCRSAAFEIRRRSC